MVVSCTFGAALISSGLAAGITVSVAKSSSRGVSIPSGKYFCVVQGDSVDETGTVEAVLTASGHGTVIARIGDEKPCVALVGPGGGGGPIFGGPIISIGKNPPMVVALQTITLPEGGIALTGTITEDGETLYVTLKQLAPPAASAALAGRYTLLLESGSESAPTGLRGFGAATVSAKGRVKFNAFLSDGSVLTQTTTLNSAGGWDLFAKSSTGAVLSGAVTFANDQQSDFSGALELQSDGNPDESLEIVGSAFQPDQHWGFSNPEFDASADLTSAPTFTAKLNESNHLLNLGGLNPVALFLAPRNGFVVGGYVPSLGQAHLVAGVVFQKTDTAYGLDEDVSGVSITKHSLIGSALNLARHPGAAASQFNDLLSGVRKTLADQPPGIFEVKGTPGSGGNSGSGNTGSSLSGATLTLGEPETYDGTTTIGGVKQGVGTLTLGGGISGSGSVTVSGGTLTVGAGGGTLDLGLGGGLYFPPPPVGGVTFDSSPSSGGTLTLSPPPSSGGVVYSGTINGTGALTSGSGVLTGSNPIDSQSVTLNAGALSVATGDSNTITLKGGGSSLTVRANMELAGKTVTLSDTASLILQAPSSVTLSGTGSLTLPGSSPLVVDGHTITLSGLTGAATFTVNPSGGISVGVDESEPSLELSITSNSFAAVASPGSLADAGSVTLSLANGGVSPGTYILATGQPFVFNNAAFTISTVSAPTQNVSVGYSSIVSQNGGASISLVTNNGNGDITNGNGVVSSGGHYIIPTDFGTPILFGNGNGDPGGSVDSGSTYFLTITGDPNIDFTTSSPVVDVPNAPPTTTAPSPDRLLSGEIYLDAGSQTSAGFFNDFGKRTKISVNGVTYTVKSLRLKFKRARANGEPAIVLDGVTFEL